MSISQQDANPAAGENALEGSENTAEAYQAQQFEEYNNIWKICRFIRIKDKLDAEIKKTLKTLNVVLEGPPTMESTDFAYNDISDNAHALSSTDSLLIPDFFARTTLVFRLFRRTLNLHPVSRISMETVVAVETTESEKQDPRIKEHAWFLCLDRCFRN